MFDANRFLDRFVSYKLQHIVMMKLFLFLCFPVKQKGIEFVRLYLFDCYSIPIALDVFEYYSKTAFSKNFTFLSIKIDGFRDVLVGFCCFKNKIKRLNYASS